MDNITNNARSSQNDTNRASVNNNSTESGVEVRSNSQPVENDALVAELKKSQEQYAEEHDKYIRTLASLDNLKKRVQKEREEMRSSVVGAMIEDLLPVLDHFELGLQSIDQSSAADNLFSGFKMIFGQFKDILKGYGLVTIDPVGQQFDPHEHECIRREYSEKSPENAVLLVMRKGYKIGDRLIRPATVVVSTNQQVQ